MFNEVARLVPPGARQRARRREVEEEVRRWEVQPAADEPRRPLSAAADT